MDKQRFNSLQCLRAFMAISVCLTHIISTSVITKVQKMSAFFDIFGHLGVDISFTISGFIFTWLLLKTHDVFSFKKAVCFFIKRVFKIYPLFWITLLFMCVLLLLTHINIEAVHEVLRPSVLLLLTTHIPLQNPAWTLPYEVYFYLVVFIFICFSSREKILLFFTIWICIHLMLTYLVGYHVIPKIPIVFYNNQLLDYYFGLCIAYYMYQNPKINIIYSYIIIVISIVLLILTLIIEAIYGVYFRDTNILSILFNRLPAALILYGFVTLERAKKLHLPQAICKVGDMSYSIYLWHFPIIHCTNILFYYFVFLGKIPYVIIFSCQFILVIIVSILSYRWIEKPLLTLSHHIVKKIA